MAEEANHQADIALWEIQNSLFKEKNLSLHFKDTAPPAPKKEEEPKRKFKWAVEAVDSGFKLDFATAKPVQDIFSINWEDGIKGIERSEAGSEGAFFVCMNTTGVFVIKPSRGIGTEVFTNLLALKLGVYSPKIRILHSRGAEGDKFLNQVVKVDKTGKAIHSLLQAEYLLIKEFVRGKNLDKHEYDDFQGYFGVETHINENGKKRLKELAAILALDVLTNNPDRLPFIWENQGNSGNLMLTNEGQFISIENALNALDEKTKPSISEYSARVEKLFSKLTANPTQLLPEFEHVNRKILEFADYSFQDVGTIMLQEAFVGILKESVSVDLETPMNNWKELLYRFSPPVVGVESINVSYIAKLWKVFQEYGAKC